MEKERHLIDDASFDVFERASYGYGCEIEQKEIDDKNVKCKDIFKQNLHNKKIILIYVNIQIQCAIWDMDHQQNYFQTPSKRSLPLKASLSVKINA